MERFLPTSLVPSCAYSEERGKRPLLGLRPLHTRIALPIVSPRFVRAAKLRDAYLESWQPFRWLN